MGIHKIKGDVKKWKPAQLKKMDFMPFTIRGTLLMIWQLFLWVGLPVMKKQA